MSEYFQKAKKYVLMADHILSTTYPLVKDTKILLRSIEHCFLAVTNSLTAILTYERSQKNVLPFHKTFESKFNIFQNQLSKKYNVSESDVAFIKELHTTILFHRSSSMEIASQSQYVMLADDYEKKTLTQDSVRISIQQTRSFIERMEKELKQNGG